MKMDFKSLISKLDSMEAPPQTPAAPVLAKAVQLNEDAQLRVLSGRTTYVAEAKKKAEEDVKEEMKVGDKKASSTGGTIEKTKTGVKHTAGKNYGGDKAPKDDEEDTAKSKKAKKESIEPVFKSKFMKMVEAAKDESDAAAKKKKEDKKKKMAKIMDEGAKPDFLDVDKDGNKKEPMKKAVADKKGAAPKKGVNPFAKKEVKEATKTDKPWTDMSGKKQPGTAVKGDKYTGKDAEKEAKAKSKKDESTQRYNSMVAEGAVSFKEMIQLVHESGGQQQIDAIDQELFAWAQRVAKQKIGEGLKADVYAGMVYERMGGVFEMYDVLSEDQK